MAAEGQERSGEELWRLEDSAGEMARAGGVGIGDRTRVQAVRPHDAHGIGHGKRAGVRTVALAPRAVFVLAVAVAVAKTCKAHDDRQDSRCKECDSAYPHCPHYTMDCAGRGAVGHLRRSDTLLGIGTTRDPDMVE